MTSLASHARFTALCMVSCCLLVACPGAEMPPPGSDGGGSDGGSTDAPGGGGDTWTVFVYGHADHNLSPSLVTDIEEMQGATFGNDFQIIVMTDYDGSATGFATGTEWLRVRSGMSEVLAMEAEQDLDDPAVLRASIARAFNEHPADRHGLVMWDHGGAWEGGFGADNQDGTRPMAPGVTIDQLEMAIAGGLADASVTRLEFLTFDTCLMAGAEVLVPLASLSEIYIANAELDYGAGWDYTATFSYLAATPAVSMADFARAETMHWNAHHASMGIEDMEIRAHTSYDTSRVAAFTTAAADLVTAWQASTSLDPEDVARAAYTSVPGYNNSNLDALSSDPALRDFGQFLDGLSTTTSDPAVASAAGAARTALAEMTLSSSLGARRAAAMQSGLHVELPSAASIPDRLAMYRMRAGSWVSATGWDTALESLSMSNDGTPPTLTVVAAGTLTIELTPGGTDVGSATVAVVSLDGGDPDRLVLEEVLDTGSVQPGVTYTETWDGNLASIGASAVSMQPFFETEAELATTSPSLYVVPGILGTGADVVEGALLVQASDLTVVGVAIFLDGDLPSIFELVDLVGETFTPTFGGGVASTGAPFELSGDPLVLAAGLSVTYAPAPAGDYVLYVEIADVWGNTVADGVTFTL